jgi:hypothetical protein
VVGGNISAGDLVADLSPIVKGPLYLSQYGKNEALDAVFGLDGVVTKPPIRRISPDNGGAIEFEDGSRGGILELYPRSDEFLYLYRQTDVPPFLQRVEECVWNRRLTKTSNNRMGLVPEETRKDDLVIILLGCSVPVVLRPVRNCNKLISEAYIHGIMEGEAMREEGADEFQDFDLI